MTRSTCRAVGAGLLAAVWAASATPAALGQIVNPPGGTTVTWTDDASNGDWQDADNWNVHVPEDGDAVIIDDSHYNVVLHADAERIRSLFVAGGIGLYNFGHSLPVGNDDNDATTTVTGNGSAVIISDIPGTGPAFDTDYLELQSGGELQMDGGARSGGPRDRHERRQLDRRSRRAGGRRQRRRGARVQPHVRTDGRRRQSADRHDRRRHDRPRRGVHRRDRREQRPDSGRRAVRPHFRHAAHRQRQQGGL